MRTHRPIRRLYFSGAAPFDALEPRTLLGTIVVLNTKDNGAGSLRAAVAAAQDGATIEFASRLSDRTISLRSEIDITKSITILGPTNGRVKS